MKISSILLAFSVLIAIINCSTDIIQMQLLEKHHMDYSAGTHFIEIPSFENDEMAFEVTAMYSTSFDSPIYNDFVIYIRGFNVIPSEADILDLNQYVTQLEKYETTEYDDRVVFSYPFETIENVQHLGFYFYTGYNYDLYIYIKSDKAETALAIIILIVLVIVICLAAIGAAATFLLRKFGCWVRVHSSSI